MRRLCRTGPYISYPGGELCLVSMSGKVIFDLELVAFSKGSKSRSRNSFFILTFSFLVFNLLFYRTRRYMQEEATTLRHLARSNVRCDQPELTIGPSLDFHRSRTVSGRFVPGIPPILVKSATILTCRVDGFEIIRGTLSWIKALSRPLEGSTSASCEWRKQLKWM